LQRVRQKRYRVQVLVVDNGEAGDVESVLSEIAQLDVVDGERDEHVVESYFDHVQ
jgi:hypothetical protein